MTAGRCWRRVLLVVGGLLIVQAAWVLVVPAFGGMDEFSHAYRAASVAAGHTVDRVPRTDGSGDLIRVPRDIVAAAHGPCTALPYTTVANCGSVSTPDASGDVLVASTAARYNPVYYAVVGTAARPFTGSGALYVMRAATALWCDVMILIAVWIAIACGRSLWPGVALVTASTPVLLCATAIAAPNGVEMSAALTAWTAGLALAGRRSTGTLTDRRLLWILSAALSVVTATHSLGVAWAGLTVLALAALTGRRRLVDFYRARLLAGPATLLGAVAVACIGWTLAEGANSPSLVPTRDVAMPTATFLLQPVVWIVQTIAAVPFRDQPGPAVVVAIGIASFAAVLLLGLRRMDRRGRLVLSAVAVVSLVTPLVLTAVTFSKLGFAWQGRYELPLAYGMLLGTAWALDAARPVKRAAVVQRTIVGGFGVAQVVTLGHVIGLMHPGQAWYSVAPNTVAVMALAVVGSLAVSGGLDRVALPRRGPCAHAPIPEVVA